MGDSKWHPPKALDKEVVDTFCCRVSLGQNPIHTFQHVEICWEEYVCTPSVHQICAVVNCSASSLADAQNIVHMSEFISK